MGLKGRIEERGAEGSGILQRGGGATFETRRERNVGKTLQQTADMQSSTRIREKEPWSLRLGGGKVQAAAGDAKTGSL